jgi:hypothetical protein
MDRILDLAESRKAKVEKTEQFREAGDDLLTLLERQRDAIPEEYLAFLLALAVSDQAMHYATVAKNKEAGHAFMENLFTTARQLFETHYPQPRKPSRVPFRTEASPGRVLEFPPGDADDPLE